MFALLAIIGFVPAGEPVSCGASCLYLLVREVGQPIALEDATAILPDVPEGHCLTDLQKAMAAHGVSTSVVNIRGKALPKGPFIGHFKSADGDPVGHFAFFRPLEPTFTQYQMIAAPFDPEVVEARDLLERTDFSGFVLAPTTTSWNLVLSGGLLVVAIVIFRWRAWSRNATARSRRTEKF